MTFDDSLFPPGVQYRHRECGPEGRGGTCNAAASSLAGVRTHRCSRLPPPSEMHPKNPATNSRSRSPHSLLEAMIASAAAFQRKSARNVALAGCGGRSPFDQRCPIDLTCKGQALVGKRQVPKEGTLLARPGKTGPSLLCFEI